ncbi:EI24 domain-containing protein [Puia sp. P3]|uniref:EI24 domain-containing protein n=1 Tax=Puia sp. P3 TaxID=3423952 RepID=UPI003D66A042
MDPDTGDFVYRSFLCGDVFFLDFDERGGILVEQGDRDPAVVAPSAECSTQLPVRDGGIMFHLVLVFFYFSLFKYLFLIIGSPLFAYLSEQTEALINGKEYSFRLDAQLMSDMGRGVRLAVRNSLWQTVYTISILILSFIPLVGWITPVICTFVECYYYGFSMLDYSCMRHRLGSAASVAYISQHKGLAIGNGMVFF